MPRTFPLLLLPSEAIKNVFEYSDVPEIIFFSTLSNRAKRLVKSLKLRAPTIQIHLYLGCKIVFRHLYTIRFGVNRQGQCDIESMTPCTLQMTDSTEYRDDIYFTLPGFGVREWFEHFSFTFNQPLIDVNFDSRRYWTYTFESMCKLLKGFSIGSLTVKENACEVMRQFPLMQSLSMDKTDSEPELQGEDLNFIKKVLVGNIVSVQIRRAIPMDLNTLLMMNSTNISSVRSIVTDKELNRFIKLWLKGANPNLERLALGYIYSEKRRGIIRKFDENIIFKGIGCQKLIEEKRIYWSARYHIWKSDGTLAEVYFKFPNFFLNVLQC